MNKLSHDIVNHIYDFANIDEYWKRRMTNDVLVKIDLNYRLVRFIGTGYSQPFESSKPCLHCYFHTNSNIFCNGCLTKNTRWGVINITQTGIKYYDLHIELLYYCKIQKRNIINILSQKNKLLASVKMRKYCL